jgi:hypothetical protein
MTKQLRRMEINIETHKITKIRSTNRLNTIYCIICQKSVTTFSIDQIESISQLMETKDFHLIQTIKGSLICGNSLETNNK